MPITPTYPGIYIEELPSNAHTIAAAPTSVTVFVGYTHPFKTNPINFGAAIEIFSFTDYEREFGGFFTNAIYSGEDGDYGSMAHAVSQFYLNGGSDAWIVALESKPGGASLTAPTIDMNGVTFTAREPTDTDHEMNITIANISGDLADITITYGNVAESYRKVSVTKGPDSNPNPNFIESRIGTADKPISALVSVSPTAANYPANFTAGGPTAFAHAPADASTIFNAADFNDVFQQDSALDKVSIFNLLVLPGVINNGILSEALAFCERKQAFLIMDPPIGDVADPPTDWVGDFVGNPVGDTGGNIAPLSTNGAVYFPYLKSSDPVTGDTINLPPSGTVAGIYARTDTNRGVWKAPAGLETIVHNTTGVVDTGRMTDLRQGVLNMKGIDCLRTFPGVGTVVFGARTLVSANTAFQQWKYVPVRRMALFLEQTLYRNLGWVVFEPNDDPLLTAIRTSIEGFMLTLFHQGAFQGSTPSQAFQVKCDATTTTQQDIDNGIVNIIVAFAPLKPAEFVIIKIAQLAGQVQS